MPIEPTPDQFADWMADAIKDGVAGKIGLVCERIAKAAYTAGADAELNECCEWLYAHSTKQMGGLLRAARRPKPLSRKAQAMAQLEALTSEMRRHGLQVPSCDVLDAVLADSPDD